MKKHLSFLTVAIAFTLIVAGYEGAVNGRAIGASIAPFVTTTCSSTIPCIEGANTSSGTGVLAESANGRGLYALTKHNSTSAASGTFGVLGLDDSASGTFNSGVEGLSVRGTGVSGSSSNGYGVNGSSTNGYGVGGSSTNSIGLYGSSTNYLGVYGVGPTYGVYGAATTGYGAVDVSGNVGVYATGPSYGMYSVSSGKAVLGSTTGGVAIYAQSSSGRAFEGHTGSGVGLYVTNAGGNGGDVTGSYIGTITRSNTYPLVATDASGNVVFYVDGSGNVSYHGALQSFSERRAGVVLYNPQSTMPAVEETGTARLRLGRASVYFSSNFARSIDVRRGYQVFLTPNADTRGLYVEGKYARGFMVREVAGGRGSFDFDYRVYARADQPEVSAPAAEPNASILRAPVESKALPVPPRPRP